MVFILLIFLYLHIYKFSLLSIYHIYLHPFPNFPSYLSPFFDILFTICPLNFQYYLLSIFCYHSFLCPFFLFSFTLYFLYFPRIPNFPFDLFLSLGCLYPKSWFFFYLFPSFIQCSVPYFLYWHIPIIDSFSYIPSFTYKYKISNIPNLPNVPNVPNAP